MQKLIANCLAILSLTVSLNHARAETAIWEVSETPPADFIDAFGTRVFPNDSPCLPENAPQAKQDMAGNYIGLFPGGQMAKDWDISVKLKGTQSVFHLGAGVLPLVYGITADGKNMVRTHGMHSDLDDSLFIFQGLFPIWGVMIDQKWACYYMPDYDYANSW